LQVQQESWEALAPDLLPLMAAHHQEIGEALPFKPALEVFAHMAELGLLVAVSGRAPSGVLAGYCLWTLGPHLASFDVLTATQGPWYVDPGSRNGLGYRMLRHSLALLRNYRCQRVYLHHWGDPRLGALFKSLGAAPLEQVYSLALEA
jgi:hypothetical protein